MLPTLGLLARVAGVVRRLVAFAINIRPILGACAVTRCGVTSSVMGRYYRVDPETRVLRD
jgi:hypothetical protein